MALIVSSFVEKLKMRIKKKEKSRITFNIVLYGMVTLFGCICIFSIWEGCPALAEPAYDTIEAEYTSDKEFVETIESEVEPGAMIYQLPYHKYPEEGPVNDMADYHLFIGFLHSDTLKWSYGSIKGREEDKWNESVSKMGYEEMVSYLKNQGFSGIYVARRAYTSEELRDLEKELESATGDKPIESNNKNLSFFKF